MKANEFVKQYGINEAKRIIPICEKQGAGLTVSGCRVNLDDLKRLVESHELVEAEGGLLNVKNSFQMERDCGGVDMTPFGKKLKHAIADVESCL